jgi:hypothetical protein
MSVTTSQHEAFSIRDNLYARTEPLDPQTEATSKSYLPEYEPRAMYVIFKRLGFTPLEDIAKKHEFFIRWILCRYDQGQFQSLDDLYSELDTHIKHIRNASMKDVSSSMSETISWGAFDRYQNENTEFAEIVREKIKFILGYIPETEFTLKPELRLRKFLAKSGSEFATHITGADYYTATIIKYRETKSKFGEQAANDLPPLGQFVL